MNRAVGKRMLFEDDIDIRLFLACVARSVRRGEIRVFAYAILTTHFHLLVESCLGALGAAMRRIESAYVRAFNQRHDRDGPLVRGRFCSKIVASYGYWRRLVRYIDQNPVQAGIAKVPWDYKHGSAAHYVRGRGPRWLDRSVIQGEVRALSGMRPFDGADYQRIFGSPASPAEQEWLLSRLTYGDREPDPLPHLLKAAPRAVRAWLEERTRIADGTRAGMPVIDVDSLTQTLKEQALESPHWMVGHSRLMARGWKLAEVGLLRDLCGLPLRGISHRIQRPVSSVSQLYAAYAEAMRDDPAFRDRAVSAARAALRRFGEEPEVAKLSVEAAVHRATTAAGRSTPRAKP